MSSPSSLSKLMGDRPDEGQVRRERRKEARPGELLDAALDLFVEKGFAATRAEEVAVRAGVSKGTLFLYFPSKEELFKAVVRENISGRFAEWERRSRWLKSGGPPPNGPRQPLPDLLEQHPAAGLFGD